MADFASLDPNQRLGQKNQSRYPSPFFDISQQYMPPTVKELFKWCYFYATTNSLVGPALKKIARYPVTDLIYESANEDIAHQYRYLFDRTFKIKAFLMETNLDMHVYGNAFVSMYYPFTRFTQCQTCAEKELFRTSDIKITPTLKVELRCRRCKTVGEAKILDITYRSKEKLRLVRLNPEYIDIKYNDSNGEHEYVYNIPDKLKRMLVTGEKSIYETTPMVYIDAIKKKVKISLNPQNLFHLKNPTVAGKDYGWGIPTISPVLKDLYYYYNLRRAQEAIMNEHITPLDIISPAPNGQMDPYIHSNLANFKRQIQDQIAKHRRDPNYKAILPFPVKHDRVGGDGKAMLLQGELDFLSQTIIGGMGIPKEFVFGGLNWTGSSVSLRTLENEFFHHRSQLLELVFWIKDKARIYLAMPDIDSIRFLDFKMADDVQRLQLVGGLEAAGKISTSTYLTELGYDFETEQKKRMKEADLLSKVNDRLQMQAAVSQSKVNEVQARAQMKLNELMGQSTGVDPSTGLPVGQPPGGGAGQPGADPNQPNNVINFPGAEGGGQPGGGPTGQNQPDLDKTVDGLAKKLLGGDPQAVKVFINQLTQTAPQLSQMVQQRMAEMQQGTKGPTNQALQPAPGAKGGKPSMKPLPEQRAPTRQGSV